MSIADLLDDFDRANFLNNLLVAKATGKDADNGDFQALRAHFLQAYPQLLPSFVRTNSTLDSFWTFIQPKFATYAERRTFISKEITPLLDHLDPGIARANSQGNVGSPAGIAVLSAPRGDAPIAPRNAAPIPPRGPAPIAPWGPAPMAPPSWNSDPNGPVLQVERNKRKVFIVHGRDNEAKLEVANFVISLGLDAIILHQQASVGLTIIEKIERYANDADFALVLYTPCDQGRGTQETKVPARYRARQNVVFEHGYLIAKLSRQNVCALKKGDIEIPNDISGVVYVDFDQYGGWKAEVVKELRACGYTVVY